MANNRLTTRIILRNDSSTQWLANSDQKLLKGEVGIEFIYANAGDLVPSKTKIKIGDGTSTWAQLPYFGGDECKVTELEVAKGTTHSTKLAEIVNPNKGDIAIIKEAVIASDKLTTGVIQQYQYTAYVYGETASGSAWKAMDGNYSADNVYFDEDFTFTTKVGTVQSLTNGSTKVEAAGKSVKQFFSGLFAEEVAGGADTTATSKGQPYATVTLKNDGTNITADTSYEVGTTIKPSYSASFEDGKYTYGPEPTGVTVSSWSVTSTASESWTSSSATGSDFIVGDSTSYSITATATHSEGSAALSNIGNAGTYKFSSGTKSATSKKITGYRTQFFGALETPVTLNSTNIRNLPGKVKPTNTFNGKYAGNNANGYQLKFENNNNTNQVIIALYGKTLKNVYDHAAFGTDIKDSFVEVSATTAISVEGADSYAAKDYKVYVYAPDAALGDNTYDIVIG